MKDSTPPPKGSEHNQVQEWSEWTQAWKSDESEPSQEELQKEVIKQQRQMTRKLFMELFASILVIAYYAYTLWIEKNTSWPVIVLASGTTVFLAFWMARVFKTYQESQSSMGDSTKEHILCLKEQTQAKLRFLDFADKALLCIFVFGLIWCPWMFWTHIEGYIQHPGSAIIGFGGFFGILLGLKLFYKHKRKALHQELDSLEKTYTALFTG